MVRGKRISGMSFKELLIEAGTIDPQSTVEILSALPAHPKAQFTWQARVKGRGLYMGEANEYTDENGEKFLTLAGPDLFFSEN